MKKIKTDYEIMEQFGLMQKESSFDPKQRDLYLGDVTPESIQELIEKITAINVYESDEYEKDVNSLNYLIKKRNVTIPEDTEIDNGEIEAIRLHIASYGGSLYDCLALINVIKNSKVPIVAIVHYAMSAGALITAVCHHRIGYELSTVMIHNLSSASWGQLQSMREDVKQSEVLEAKMIKLFTEYTKISEEKLKEVFEKKKDWYIEADECLELGIFDEIWEKAEVVADDGE